MYLWATLIVITVLLLTSIYYNYKFGIIILHVQDSIEDSLDILDERYTSISTILEIPIFSDSREVRLVLEDIKISRDAILDIARELTTIDEIDETETSDTPELPEEEEVA